MSHRNTIMAQESTNYIIPAHLLNEPATVEPPSPKSEAQPPKPKSPRAYALDALRGLAILGMVLSGMVPYNENTLPAWMYHAQVPPPSHIYDSAISGITWVDVVFPFFLFSLGAAIPLALGARIDRGDSRWKLAGHALLRGALLIFFALYVKHLSPWTLRHGYGTMAWPLALLAFLILFPIFMRFPRKWPAIAHHSLRISGFVTAGIFLAMIHYEDGSGFTVHRHDIILTILGNVIVGTTFVWLLLRGRISALVTATAFITTIFLATRFSPHLLSVLNLDFLKPLIGERILNGIAWACRPTYQQYLMITLPGAVAGTLLAEWINPETLRLTSSIHHSRWRELSLFRCLALSVISFAMVVCAIMSLTLTDIRLTAMIIAGLGALGAILLFAPPARKRLKLSGGLRGQPRVDARLFQGLFLWGMLWLGVGLVALVIEGVIKKDPPTFSYLFLCAGLACMTLLTLAIITDAFHRRGLVFLLIDNGQNPMIAYVAGSMAIFPVMQMIPVGDMTLLDWIGSQSTSITGGFIRAFAYTLMVAVFVSVLTRLKIFWRT